MEFPDNTERYLNDYLASIRQKEFSNPSKSYDDFIEKLRKIDGHSTSNSKICVLMNIRKFKILYVSPNSEAFNGRSQAEMLNLSALDMFRMIQLKSLSYPLKGILWNDSLKKKFSSPPINHKMFGAGMVIKHKKNDDFRTLIKNIPLEYDSKKNPTVVLALIYNINHLMKKNFYWYRITEGSDQQKVKGFFTTNAGKTKYKDAFSKREMEILNLLQSNHNTKDISEQLAITINTVEKHRKNMIARLGAKDSTALVQLCKMAEII